MIEVVVTRLQVAVGCVVCRLTVSFRARGIWSILGGLPDCPRGPKSFRAPDLLATRMCWMSFPLCGSPVQRQLGSEKRIGRLPVSIVCGATDVSGATDALVLAGYSRGGSF